MAAQSHQLKANPKQQRDDAQKPKDEEAVKSPRNIADERLHLMLFRRHLFQQRCRTVVFRCHHRVSSIRAIAARATTQDRRKRLALFRASPEKNALHQLGQLR